MSAPSPGVTRTAYARTLERALLGTGVGMGVENSGSAGFASERCAQSRVLTLLSNELTLEG